MESLVEDAHHGCLKMPGLTYWIGCSPRQVGWLSSSFEIGSDTASSKEMFTGPLQN